MAANIAAASVAAQEVDPVLKKAVKLLHSGNSTSAAELRLMLDEALKLRCAPEKLVSNNLTQRMMDDEANFPGRAPTPLPQQMVQLGSDEIINLTNSPDKVPSDSPGTIIDSDDCMSGAGVAITGVVNTGDTGDFGDLNCCVCGEMVFTATNRLIECSKCGALYHQECHKPPITKEEAADDQEHNWQCDACCNKPTSSKAAIPPTVIIPDEPMPLARKAKSSVASSRSSTSSNSSSPFYKPEAGSSTNASSSSSSKHGHKTSSSSSSSKSHKEERASKSLAPAPALPVISAPEKHTGSSSSRRSSSNKSSSKSGSSKHHESSSSSSKRRSK